VLIPSKHPMADYNGPSSMTFSQAFIKPLIKPS
jgi:hypothetical protein